MPRILPYSEDMNICETCETHPINFALSETECPWCWLGEVKILKTKVIA